MQQKRGRPTVPYRANSNPQRVEKKARLALENIAGGAEEVPSLLQALSPVQVGETDKMLNQLRYNISDLAPSFSVLPFFHAFQIELCQTPLRC